MKGAFYCPHCKTPNACDCTSCKPYITEEDTVAIRHDEHLTCGKCSKDYSYNQALDTEWEIRKLDHEDY